MAELPDTPPKLAVQLRAVPASQGWHWVRQGMNLTMSHPLGFVGLWCATMLAWFLVSLLAQPVGAIVVAGSMPIVWLAFMRATRRAMAGAPITLRVYSEVWAVPPARRQALLAVCGLYVLALVVVLLLVKLLGPGVSELGGLNSGDPKAFEEAMLSPQFLGNLAWFAGLMVPVSILFWHAPPLVHSVGLRPAKALFFSWMACWHNRWAFAVYGLAWGGVAMTMSLMLSLIAQLAGSAELLAMLSTPASMLLGAGFYASLYFTVADCFEAKIAE